MSVLQTAAANDSEFLPVDLRDFVAGRPPLVDLYHLSHGQPVLYCEANAIFTREARLRLLRNDITTLYVHITDGRVDARGLDLPTLLAIPDSQLQANVKTSLLNSVVTHTVREMFAAPSQKDSMLRTQSMVDAMVVHMLRGQNTLHALIRSMRHDSSLYSHAVNVMTYAAGLGLALGVKEDDLVKLSLGALLHDLGKTKLPASLQNKPADLLTEEEQSLVRNHPVWGVQLLAENAASHPVARTIIMQHHERLDGSGYPKGLGQFQIHPLARIVALVDVYDNLTSERSGQPPMSPYGALRFIEERQAGQVEPRHFAAFVQMLGESQIGAEIVDLKPSEPTRAPHAPGSANAPAEARGEQSEASPDGPAAGAVRLSAIREPTDEEVAALLRLVGDEAPQTEDQTPSPRGREREQLLGAIVDRVPVGIAILRGPDLVHEMINPAFQALVPDRPMENRPFAEVWPELAPKVLPILRRTLQTGEPYQAEEEPFLMQREPGGAKQTIYLNLAFQRLGLSEGQADAVMAVMSELTDQVAARQKTQEWAQKQASELKATLGLLKLLLQSTDEGICGVDLQGRCTFMNRAGAAMLGRKPEECSGKVITELVACRHQDGTPYSENDCLVFRCLRTGQGTRSQEDMLWWNGEAWFPVELSAHPLLRGQATQGAVITFSDITERSRAENALRRRLAAEELVAHFSTRFINVPAEEVDAEIPGLLQALAEFAGVQRTYVMLLQSDGMTVERAYEWCSTGIPHEADQLPGVSLAGYAWAMATLGRGEIINVPCVAELPPEAVAEKREWQRKGVRSVLSIPLANGAALVGILGLHSYLAEKAWSEEDVRLPGTLGDLLLGALQRERSHRALAYRLAMEELAAKLSSRLIGVDLAEMDREIEHALKEVGQFAAVDRVFLTLLRSDGTTIERVYEWCSEGIGPFADDLAGSSLASHTWLMGKLRRLEVANVASISDLPPEAGPEKQVWQERGTRSALTIPLALGATLVGFMGLNSHRKEKAWAEEDVKLLKLVGEALLNAVERGRSDERIRHQIAQAQALSRTASLLNAQLELDGLLDVVCEEAAKALHAPASAVLLLDEPSATLRLAATYGLPPQFCQRHAPLPRTLYDSLHSRPGSVRVLADAQARPDLPNAPLYAEFDIRTVAAASLGTDSALVGLLCVLATGRPRTFGEDELILLEGLAGQASLAINRAQLYSANLSQLESLNTLYLSAYQLTKSADLQQQADYVTRTCVEAFGVRAAWIQRVEPDGSLRLLSHFPPHWHPNGRLSERWDDEAAHQSPGGRAMRAGLPVVVPDLANTSLSIAWREEVLASGLNTIACFPLTARGQAFGLLTLGSERESFFSLDTVDTLLAFSLQAAASMENSRLFAEAERRLKRVQALHNLDLAITGSLDLRVILNTFLGEVINQLGVDAAAVLLLDRHTQTLRYAAEKGFGTKDAERPSLRLGEGHAGQVALERRLISIPDLTQVEGQSAHSLPSREQGFVAYLGLPLLAKGRVMGVLEVYHRSSLAPDQEWLSFLESLGAQAAIAIDNASLFEELEHSHYKLLRAYDETIAGWSRALDLRDKETEDHALRVTEVTVSLARAMGLTDAELEHLRRGVLLHDIGKMAIPDSILLKPGPLDDSEREVMRRHPVYAYELLSAVAFLRPALDIPYCHHEKWDGTGYPRGLKGEEIPLAARIFAVVDVWDALRSDRPYRPAWPEEKVREYLSEQAGKHFDPKAVETFLEQVAIAYGPSQQS